MSQRAGQPQRPSRSWIARVPTGLLLGVGMLCPSLSPDRPVQADSVVEVDSLLPLGNFESDVDWGFKDGACLEREHSNRFLRLEVVEPSKAVMGYRTVPLAVSDKALELEYRVGYSGIKPGKQKWFDGWVMINFRNEAGKIVRPSPSAPSFKGTSKNGWENRSH